MKYKAILFDLDGTLADTAPGIRDCYKYALNVMGKPVPTDDQLAGVIGASPLVIFQTRFDIDETEARQAVTVYRAHYAEEGIRKAKIYSGVPQLLNRLKEKGYLIGVATLKAEVFAKMMLENMGVAKYFDVIKGMDGHYELTKAAILTHCLRVLNVLPENALLIGDSYYDAEGAALAGVDFAAVLYGYGFSDITEAIQWNPVLTAGSPEDIGVFL